MRVLAHVYERVSMDVCVSEQEIERESVCVCVCVCVRERITDVFMCTKEPRVCPLL